MDKMKKKFAEICYIYIKKVKYGKLSVNVKNHHEISIVSF